MILKFLILSSYFYFFKRLFLEIFLSTESPLSILNLDEKYDIFVKTKGGGVSGQSEAIKRFNCI